MNEAITVVETSKERLFEAEVCRIAGEVALLAPECDVDKAEAHFEDALEMNERMRARPWLAHTKAHYALLLRRRGRRGEGERAEILANEAWEIAAELDMVLLKQRLQPKIH